MNFELTEEQLTVQKAARDFAQTELLPGVIDRDGIPPLCRREVPISELRSVVATRPRRHHHRARLGARPRRWRPLLGPAPGDSFRRSTRDDRARGGCWSENDALCDGTLSVLCRRGSQPTLTRRLLCAAVPPLEQTVAGSTRPHLRTRTSWLSSAFCDSSFAGRALVNLAER